MQRPQINNNGSSAEELIGNYREINRRAVDLIEALYNAYPHGRDYQTLDNDKYVIAREEHNYQVEQVVRIREWSKEMHRSLYKQMKE